MDNQLLVALGANLNSALGPPAQTLRAALTELQDRGAVIRAVSPFYHTSAFPPGSGPDFVNAAASLCAAWTPFEAVSHLHEIETAMGRTRKRRWAGRTLDLDLIACDGQVLPDVTTFSKWRDLPLADQMARTPDQLILPHPRLAERAFVLVPLADVAAGWVHPVSGQSVAEMLAALPEQDRADVRLAEGN